MPELHATRSQSPPADQAALATAPPAPSEFEDPEPPPRGFLPNFHRNEMWAYFGPAFVDKGRFSPMRKAMPVAVVKSSSIGLHGSARHAAGLG